MRTQALEDIFIDELEEIYDAEKQLHKGLGRMAKIAHHEELKTAFTNHLKETDEQAKRLEKCFEILGAKANRRDAAGLPELIKDARKFVSDDSHDASVADAGLISSAQKIEHYEIAAYGCLRTHAAILGYKEVEELLEKSLKEEEAADRLLTEIAELTVNPAAAAAPYSQARTGIRQGRGSSGAKGSSIGKMLIGMAIGTAASLLLAPKHIRACAREYKPYGS
jgi:ferritin-like metal-binding protein YciE